MHVSMLTIVAEAMAMIKQRILCLRLCNQMALMTRTMTVAMTAVLILTRVMTLV